MAWLGDVSITKASKTEILVKSYRCTEMIFPRCAGHLAVTNKRVIFHGLAREAIWLDRALTWLRNEVGLKNAKTGCESRIVTEINVSTVSGVSSYYGHRTNLVMLTLGLLLIAVSASAALALYQAAARGSTDILRITALLLAFPGAALLCFCRRSVFFLQIFSSQAAGAPITIGEGYGNLGAARPLFAVTGRPTTETDRMITELGALISDVKEMGDRAVELWGRKTPVTGSAAKPAATVTPGAAEDYLAKAAKRLK